MFLHTFEGPMYSYNLIAEKAKTRTTTNAGRPSKKAGI